MAGAANPVDRVYHQPLWGRTDLALRRSLAVSGSLGLLTLLVVFVAPAPPPAKVTLEEMPERIARLILEKPKPPAPVRDLATRKEAPATEPEAPEVARIEKPAPRPKPRSEPRRREQKPPVAPDQGAQGRQKAAEVTANLAQVSGSLDKALGDLAQVLPTAEKSTGATDKSRPRGRPRRGVRKGRGGSQLVSVQRAAEMTSADLDASSIAGEGVSIAAITDLATAGGSGNSGGGGTAATGGGGEMRSNESLLAVVRRYAPGIQFCYENELKRNPGLRGKMVVSLTVDAAGRVSEVVVVEDTMASSAVTDCALAQIRDWKFPLVETGSTSFRTPFVFTPPQ